MAVTELVTRFSFQGSLQPLQKLNQGLDIGIGMITKLGAGLGIGALALNGFNLALVDQIDQQNDLAITLGVSIQALQEWGYVATLSGSSAQAYESSIGGLSQAIGDTANDVGRAKAIFEKMGISVKDATGKVKSADIVMEELRQKLKGLEKTEKISILSKLGIDRSMLQMLESSDESINKLRLQARALGITTDEEKEKVAEYKDSMDALGFAFTALATKMQIALTPAIKKMADNFIKLFENGTISGIINWLKDFGIATYKTIDDIVGFDNILLALGARFLWLRKAMIGAMLFNPFTYIIAGIAAVVLIYDDLTHKNSFLIAKFNELKEKAIGYFDEIANSVKNTFDGVMNDIKSFIDNIISYFQPLMDMVNSTIDSVKNFSFSSLNPFADNAETTINPNAIARQPLNNNPISPNAITQNAVPQQLMNKTLANTVNNDIKIEVKTDEPMTAGTSVKNSLEQHLKDTNSTMNKGGY